MVNRRTAVQAVREQGKKLIDCVYDETRNVIETHAHVGDFREF